MARWKEFLCNERPGTEQPWQHWQSVTVLLYLIPTFISTSLVSRSMLYRIFRCIVSEAFGSLQAMLTLGDRNEGVWVCLCGCSYCNCPKGFVSHRRTKLSPMWRLSLENIMRIQTSKVYTLRSENALLRAIKGNEIVLKYVYVYDRIKYLEIRDVFTLPSCPCARRFEYAGILV